MQKTSVVTPQKTQPLSITKAKRCQAQYVPDNVHQLHVQQPSTYEKP